MPISHQVIFVGGIHGVGKSSFCTAMAKVLEFDHVSASNLIRVSGKAPNFEQKRVDDIEENQDRLIRALQTYKSDYETILLDGHFCILGMKHEIQEIPSNTFIELAPKAILVLTESVTSICERINMRDSFMFDVNFVEKFQNAEIHHAKNISVLLQTPLSISTPNTSFEENLDFLKNHK